MNPEVLIVDQESGVEMMKVIMIIRDYLPLLHQEEECFVSNLPTT